MTTALSSTHLSLRQRDESSLLRRVAGWPEYPQLDELSVEVLCHLTQSHGLEWATALLFDRIVRSPRHADFIADIETKLCPWREIEEKLDLDIVVAPAAYYIEYPDIGGDGRLLRPVAEHLGCRFTLAPCGSGASLAYNARILADTLKTMRGRRVVLISLSKGGADVRALFETAGAGDSLRHVVAWIDLCGIASGTPLAERIIGSLWLSTLAKTACWLRGHDFRFIRELAELRRRPVIDRAAIPAGINILHAVCFPLAADISHSRARRHFARMSSLGPNDACGLLGHAVRLPGRVYPIWGVDHYIRPAWDIRDLAAAFLIQAAKPNATHDCHKA